MIYLYNQFYSPELCQKFAKNFIKQYDLPDPKYLFDKRKNSQSREIS
ncbi:hypothetical protein O180_00040 [Chlamydia trachomatis]|nr:hypothetical protein O180_00040 [Chlamydia trachomatis]